MQKGWCTVRKIISRQGKILFLFLLLFFLPAFFYPGTIPTVRAGQGDGSGGGKDQPLALALSAPADGQKDVLTTTEILLTFNKNVVHMTVCENNKKCFALFTAGGSQIPVEVVMADDQIEPEKKRDVRLKPLQGLEPATSYTISILPELQSKSGAIAGQEILVSFTTAGTIPGNAGNSKGNVPANPPADSVANSPGGTTAGKQDEKGSLVDHETAAPTSTGGDSGPAATPDPAAETSGEKIPPDGPREGLPAGESTTKQNLAEEDDPGAEKEVGLEAGAKTAAGTGASAEPSAGSPDERKPGPANKGFTVALGIIVVVGVLACYYIKKSPKGK